MKTFRRNGLATACSLVCQFWGGEAPPHFGLVFLPIYKDGAAFTASVPYALP